MASVVPKIAKGVSLYTSGTYMVLCVVAVHSNRLRISRDLRKQSPLYALAYTPCLQFTMQYLCCLTCLCSAVWLMCAQRESCAAAVSLPVERHLSTWPLETVIQTYVQTCERVCRHPQRFVPTSGWTHMLSSAECCIPTSTSACCIASHGSLLSILRHVCTYGWILGDVKQCTQNFAWAFRLESQYSAEGA